MTPTPLPALDTPDGHRVEGLGVLDFPNSGDPAAQGAFLRGVLALHSFWYVEARRSFREARRIDPGFALAYWGEAMTFDHPVWGVQDTREGRKALQRLDSVEEEYGRRWTERERTWLAVAREIFFSRGSERARRQRAEAMLMELRNDYPEDDEAVAFHSLLVVANHSHRRSHDEIMAAMTDLEGLLRRNPEHPGAYHYLIHGHDTDELARSALDWAGRYPDVAGDAPHAVHMPAHIYRRLGDWERVAASCRDAYETSARWVREEGLSVGHRDFHSLRWLHDAYLAMEAWDEARKLHRHLADLEIDGAERRRLDRIRSRFVRDYRRAR